MSGTQISAGQSLERLWTRGAKSQSQNLRFQDSNHTYRTFSDLQQTYKTASKTKRTTSTPQIRKQEVPWHDMAICLNITISRARCFRRFTTSAYLVPSRRFHIRFLNYNSVISKGLKWKWGLSQRSQQRPQDHGQGFERKEIFRDNKD